MSDLWEIADLVKATGGIATGDFRAVRLEIDSRKIRAGDLFVAIKGERFDGHEYVADALAKGAVAAVVTNPQAGFVQNNLVVLDTLKALEDLGKYNRKRSKAKVIGITGSVGKTSTKEMLKLALSVHGKTYATTGNYNNHIGTPLNLANMPLDSEFAVLEMGMNHAGEISHLTNMVRPHIALITRVEAVHLEFFDSVDDIAKAKGEIFEGLDDAGISIINSDQKYFADAQHKITFGENSKADCRLLTYEPTIAGCNVSANIRGEKIDYRLSAIGKHWAVTSISVLAVISALGLDVKKSAAALADFSEVEGRGGITKLRDALIINDSYNASPASMRSAFVKTDEVWRENGKKGKKIAILGDMLELGETAPELHLELSIELKNSGFARVYTAGVLMKHLHDALPASLRAEHTQKAMELLPLITFEKDDVVLIKGSHGSKIYELADALLAQNGEIKNAV